MRGRTRTASAGTHAERLASRDGYFAPGSLIRRHKVILLVAYIGIIALSRGITEIFLAFKLKGLRRRVAVA